MHRGHRLLFLVVFVDPPTQDACVKSVCDFRTPLREVQDRHQPPSYGNLENVLKTPPSYTFCWTGARGPSYGINPPTLILDGRHYRIDTKRRARSPGWAVPAAGHRGSGRSRTARARRDLSNAHYSMQVHTDLSKSMRRGLAMAPARFGSLWGLGPSTLCLVLLDMQIQMISWTGLCDRQRRARSAGWGVPAAGHGGPGGLRTARSRRDLSNAHYSTQIDTFDTCASRRRSRRGVRGVRPTLFNEGWSF